MAHTLTFSGVSVSVNGQRVSSPYTLSNGDTIIITTDDYIYVNDSSAISSSKTLNIENSDIVITTEGLRTNSYNVTINYTESTPRKSVDLTTLSGWAGLSSGAHSIQLKAKAAGYRDSGLSQAVSVTKGLTPKALEDCTWEEISQVSASKQWDAMGWQVGDSKTITLNGTVGTVALNNYQCKVYILGFDHNADKEGEGISFGLLEGTDGEQLCLVDSSYGSSVSSVTAFTMNTSNTNSGGWKNCKMRKTTLGSTDVTNGDATSAAITNPASGTLMAAFPADLRAVLKPITKYTNNVGNSSEASAISPTVDYLPLLSEYEVFKTHTYANSNEDTYQAQYQYYANGKPKVKCQHSDNIFNADWWLRSPSASYSNSFCAVNTRGAIASYYASSSNGVAPAFLV